MVKEEPFFEDATLKDASFFGLDKLVDHISIAKGFFVPDKSPTAHRDLFSRSDLLIVKGTGSYEALKNEKIVRLVAALPVSSKEAEEEIKKTVDEWVCPETPVDFAAVGNYYQDFTQVSDEEVVELLKQKTKD